MYHPKIEIVAIINHIICPSGPVFGTAGITVLVAHGLGVIVHGIVNWTSSHQSSGIIHIFWSQSRCFVYTNTWSLIFAVQKCNRSNVLGFCTFISTYHQFDELSVQYIFTSFHSVVYEWFTMLGFAANENHRNVLKIAERNMDNFFMKVKRNKNIHGHLINFLF